MSDKPTEKATEPKYDSKAAFADIEAAVNLKYHMGKGAYEKAKEAITGEKAKGQNKIPKAKAKPAAEK